MLCDKHLCYYYDKVDKVGDCMFKVIIADDEVIEIEYLHKMFQKHSEEFQITGIASNGEDVLRLAEETK